MTGPETPAQADEPMPKQARPWRYLLLILPFVWQVAMLPWANGFRFAWHGIPFLMLWQMTGIVFATAAIGLLYWLDRRHAQR